MQGSDYVGELVSVSFRFANFGGPLGASGCSAKFFGCGGWFLLAGRFYMLCLDEVRVPMDFSNRLGRGVVSC